MPDKIYWNTVTPQLHLVLEQLVSSHLFAPFRLVGGTSLSLQLGHRVSIDIDLFTDAPYDSIDFTAIDNYLRKAFAYVTEPTKGPVGLGRSYFIGKTEQEAVKLDLYYTDAFIQPALIAGNVRLATIEEIIAMKVDIVQRGARKKDFWDLHELLTQYSFTQMIILHKQRYPHTHDEAAIRSNFTSFANADDDFDPDCLRGKYWELVKLEIVEFVNA